jgi:hypothetical protein
MDATARTSGPSSLRSTNTTVTKKRSKSNKRRQPYIRPPARSSITPPSSPVRITERHSGIHNFMDLSSNTLNDLEVKELPSAYTQYKPLPNTVTYTEISSSNGDNHYSRLDSGNYDHYIETEEMLSPLDSFADEPIERQNFRPMLLPQDLSWNQPAHHTHPFEGTYDLQQYTYTQQDYSSRNNTIPLQAQAFLFSPAQGQTHEYTMDNRYSQGALQTNARPPQGGIFLP